MVPLTADQAVRYNIEFQNSGRAQTICLSTPAVLPFGAGYWRDRVRGVLPAQLLRIMCKNRFNPGLLDTCKLRKSNNRFDQECARCVHDNLYLDKSRSCTQEPQTLSE